MLPPNLRDNMSDVTSSFFSVYANCAAVMFLIQSMNNSMKNSMNNFIPEQVRYSMYPYLKSSIKSTFLKSSVGRKILDYLSSPNITLFFGENSRSNVDGGHRGLSGYNQRNQVYDAAEIYLSTKISPETRNFQISKSPQQKTASLTIAETQDIEESFENIKVQWRINVRSADNDYQCPKSRFQLTFHKNYKDKVMNSYIPHVLARAEAMTESEKLLKIYSYDKGEHGSGHWSSVNLEHPATFETMAMEPELKRKIIDDLDRFSKRREFYKRVGKAWKRGYLLYGPPGTGKTSLAAAMANHLHFNIYDLELTSISSNIELRKALTAITNRSIVVFEDIDCSKETISRESEEHSDVTSKPSIPKFTLSGLLNFVDGLWSSCGDERIIVFTTNHKERLDPALLRPGRMDMHIEMSYCTFNGFKILASNYLEIQETSEHRLCGEIEGLMESTNITPAEVAEELLRCDEPNDALEGLVNCLKRKRLETSKTEEEKIENTKRQKSDKMCLNFLEN